MTGTAGAAIWTRDEAIRRLRTGLLKLTDEEHSMCQVAAERGIFCMGFRRWHDFEFHEKWKRAIGVSSHLTREQMEEFANLWQLAEQIRLRVSLACDTGTAAHGACRGWNEFSDADLARYCSDILGVNVQIAP